MGIRKYLAAVAAAGATIGSVVPALGQTPIHVSASGSAGTRSIYVENLLGEDLAALPFGDGGAVPFRVRVVDENMGRTGFQVLAQMTNLYQKKSTTGYDHNVAIPSAAVSVDYLAAPVNVADVKSLVQRKFATSGTVTGAACNVITGVSDLEASCSILVDLGSLAGVKTTVAQLVDLANLGNLPLLPQKGDVDKFYNPSFLGPIASGDGAAAGAAPATYRQFVSGQTVSTTAVLDDLNSLLAGVTTDAPTETTLLDGIRATLGDTVYNSLSTRGLLADVTSAMVSTLLPLDAGSITGQTGTYLAFPVLKLDRSQIPVNGGVYEGTLVFTSI